MAEFSPSLRTRAVECPQCGEPVIAEPQGFVVSGQDASLEEPLERWTLFACEKQHPILVVKAERGSVYQGDLVMDADFDDDLYRVYPPQDRVLSSEIPGQLRQIHDEARACMRVRAYTAAVVMSGRVLEGVCDLNDVHGRTLQDRLIKIKDMGLIDGRLWDWAEALRAVRNAAAHFNGESISRQDADDALAFTEALLDYLYVLTARFNAFKDRRDKISNLKGSGRDAQDGEPPAPARQPGHCRAWT